MKTMSIQKEWLDFLREQYPVGSRIKLREMGSDDPCPIKPGATGTLQYIDDVGTFFVAWDDGRGLGLVMGQDSFTVSPPPLQTLKLYMPLTVGYYVNEDGCGWSDEEYTMGASEAVGCAPQIINALRSEHRWLENAGPEEMERGLMAYYDELDGVERKVQSYWLTAEVRDGRLWGVAECRVRGELTPDELQALKDDVEGQAADGLGENFEQRGIRIGGEQEVYAHLWQSEGWSIQTEQERFGPEQAQDGSQQVQGGMDFA